MPKRAFERREGLLIDRYQLPSGQECTAQIPAQRLGESLSQEQLQHARESSAQALDFGQGAYLLRFESRNAHTLESLMLGLEAGNIAAPGALLGYLDDPRVRPALVEAARRAPPDSLANIARVVGITGGPGAREVLRQRMNELLASSATFEDSSFFNFTAGSAASAARALLDLDPDDATAANCLRMLSQHPCAANRRSAVMNASGAYRSRLKTEAMQQLESILRPLLNDPDAELFFAALEALKEIDLVAVTERCLRLLDSCDELIPHAANFLSQLPLTNAAVVPRLIEWISKERVVRNALLVATSLGSLVPEQLRVDLIRRALEDESPSQRWAVVVCLRTLEKKLRVDLATLALKDEPDPALVKAFEADAF